MQYIDYKDLVDQKKPIMAYTLDEPYTDTDEAGIARINIRYTSLLKAELCYNVYYRNERGDWGAEFRFKRNPIKSIPTIDVPIPRPFFENDCLCKKIMGIRCPKIISIPIPRRFDVLWTSLQKIYFSMLEEDPECLEFWKTYFHQPAGQAFMNIRWGFPFGQWLGICYLFNGEDVVFDLEISDNNFKCPKTMSFAATPKPDDVCTLLVHFNGTTLPDSLTLHMQARGHEEERFYTIKFNRFK